LESRLKANTTFTELIIIILMSWDYVSELLLPRSLLFIPQVIYGHGEPCWNDIDKRKLICPSKLSGNPKSRIV
jgi:hypothetical protein